MSDEYIRKQDASDWLKQYGQDVLHGKYKFSLMYIWKNIMELPSADVVPTEPQEIGYDQCANAMLKMWMDNVVTDGEYNRIMDRLNKLYFSDGEKKE